MPETAIDIRGFKGINLREPPGMVQDDELSSCINFNIGRAGELTKRTGFALLHNGSTLGARRVQLLGHYLTSLHSQILARAGNNLFRSNNGSDWTLIDNTVRPEFGVQYANKFYMVQTDGDLLVWDGTTLTTVSDSPRGTFCLVYKDRLHILNTEAVDNSRLYFSVPGDFEDWPSINFIDVRPGDGDFLTSCAIIHDLLIIFKTKTTWALYVQGAPETWILRNINPEIGCISKHTPREIEGFLFFVGPRGVYRTDGNIFEEISESIEPIFRERIVNLTTVNIDAAAWWEDRYILLMHPDPSTFRYMVYHLRTGGWTEWKPAGTITPSTFLEIKTATPSQGLYCGDHIENGRVYRFGGGALTDAGQNFECSFRTKEYDFGLPSFMKRGKWGMLDIEATGNIQYQHTVNGNELPAKSIAGEVVRRAFKIVGPGYFRVWRFRVAFTTNGPFIFYGAVLYLHRKRSVIKAVT